MKCEICKTKEAQKNLVICSEHCGAIRTRIHELGNKYFRSIGCDNCWGDLGSGCSEECRKSSNKSAEFHGDLWELKNLILTH